MAKKLFIPGPSEVGPEVLRVLSTPQIGHRSGEFQELYARLIPKLKRFLHTSGNLYLSTSSATGMMEGAVRNLVAKRCLNLTCGAFSERWHTITVQNGRAADKLGVEWGKAIRPEAVEDALASGKYDAVTLVHNETSTGVMNPLSEIAAAVRRHPEVMLIVDAVSSMAVVDLDADALGIDLVLAGTQKGFGVPAGLTVFTASARALEKSKSIPDRGYYFDLLEFEKYHQRNQTPATPAIPQIFALDRRMDLIAAMGSERWFGRHLEMARRCRDWARRHFALYPEPGFESVSLTAIANTRKVAVAELNQKLGQRGMAISNGYGKLKELTFRIGHMGDVGMADLETLLSSIEEILKL
jgi:aspartate aminotransferase-like enzyme